MIDPQLERILEALALDGAFGADLLSDLNPDTVAREEHSRRVMVAESLCHPSGIHGHRDVYLPKMVPPKPKVSKKFRKIERLESSAMTYAEPTSEQPPVAHATIVYLGPVAPHWEIRTHFGDERLIDAFRTRVDARLLLLPKHDPQFRRNRERVNRDAERELIRLDWDLGDELHQGAASA